MKHCINDKGFANAGRRQPAAVANRVRPKGQTQVLIGR